MTSDYLPIVVDLSLPFAFQKVRTCQCRGTVCIYVFLSVVYFFIFFSPCNLGELCKFVDAVIMAIGLFYYGHYIFKSPNVSLGICHGLFVVWCLANDNNDIFVGCLFRVGSCNMFGSLYLLYFVL